MKAAEQSVEFKELTSHLNELEVSIENGDAQATLEILQRLSLNYPPNFTSW